MDEQLSQSLIKEIAESHSITVLTGAGISAESGVPTFREVQTGLWAKYDPHELATPSAFKKNPRLVWKWYEWRRSLISQVEPNAGHKALVDFERHVPKFTLITQNVDNLHQCAGSNSVIELHGNIFRNKCYKCGTHAEAYLEPKDEPPQCHYCDGLIRPDVVWFGESLPADELDRAVHSAEETDMFFSIGTSAFVQPAASLPLIALNAGAVIVEINPQTTPLTDSVSYSIRGLASRVLSRIVNSAWG